MRKIGSDLEQAQAERLADYLLTLGIETQVEPASDKQFDLWVRNEDRLEEARAEHAMFRANPLDSKYNVAQHAAALRHQREKESQQRAKLQKKFQPRPGGGVGLVGGSRMTVAIIVVCVIASLVTGFGYLNAARQQRGELPVSIKIYNQLTLLPVINRPEEMGPMGAVAKGQVWRLITPIFLHGSPMHLLFNCLFIYVFGRLIEVFYGPAFLLVLFLLGGIVGVLFQAYGPASWGATPDVIGASGGALGLFSFVWLRPMREPSVPFRVSPFNVIFILGFVLISMLPSAPFPNVANLAHLGGLVLGALVSMGLIDFLRR